MLHGNRESFFDVVEFWIENQVMLELLPPAFARQYLEFAQPQNLEKLLATAAPSTTVSSYGR